MTKNPGLYNMLIGTSYVMPKGDEALFNPIFYKNISIMKYSQIIL